MHSPERKGQMKKLIIPLDSATLKTPFGRSFFKIKTGVVRWVLLALIYGWISVFLTTTAFPWKERKEGSDEKTGDSNRFSDLENPSVNPYRYSNLKEISQNQSFLKRVQRRKSQFHAFMRDPRKDDFTRFCSTLPTPYFTRFRPN